jgi:hypothetical protein
VGGGRQAKATTTASATAEADPFGMTNKRADNEKSDGDGDDHDNSSGEIQGSLHLGGKCAAFGRDDVFGGGLERTTTETTAGPYGMTNKRTDNDKGNRQRQRRQTTTKATTKTKTKATATTTTKVARSSLRVGRRGLRG